MALTVNTNIASLTAQRNLTSSQTGLSTSLERLSSGLRINSAKDDAAGLAISERFTAQIRGLNQGARNANDGISLAQTAEGALKEVTNNLQRIRELAVQSANATNSASDRTALQSEVSALISEIDRVAQKAAFNGIKLLDGTFTSKAFQVGADNGDTISIASIASTRTSALGGYSQATVSTAAAGVGATSAITSGAGLTINTVVINNTVSDGVSTADATASAKAIATAINESGAGVTASAITTDAGDDTATSTTTTETGVISINGVNTASITAGATKTLTGDAVAAAINNISGSTGVTATNVAGAVTLEAADGRNIVYGAGSGTLTLAKAGIGAAASTTVNGTVTLTSTETISITAAGGGGFSVADTAASVVAGASIKTATVDSVSNANAAILAVDAALATVNSTRATLGAVQSRFDSVVASVQTTAENLSASRSRILDADFASETANLTKQQILQQSGIAMLAQANSIPQNVLALLQ